MVSLSNRERTAPRQAQGRRTPATTARPWVGFKSGCWAAAGRDMLFVQCPCSSVDRVPASGAGDESSILSGGTILYLRPEEYRTSPQSFQPSDLGLERSTVGVRRGRRPAPRHPFQHTSAGNPSTGRQRASSGCNSVTYTLPYSGWPISENTLTIAAEAPSVAGLTLSTLGRRPGSGPP